MADELEHVLRLVAEGRLTAEEAGPIVAALQPDAAPAGGGSSGPTAGSTGGVEAALGGRRLRIYVAEAGRQIVDLRIPLAAAGFAIDRVPGLSAEDRRRIASAIRSGLTGPILEVDDEGDAVRIVVE